VVLKVSEPAELSRLTLARRVKLLSWSWAWPLVVYQDSAVQLKDIAEFISENATWIRCGSRAEEVTVGMDRAEMRREWTVRVTGNSRKVFSLVKSGQISLIR
jgi:hypothetical protein